jgi:hypothetical protein
MAVETNGCNRQTDRQTAGMHPMYYALLLLLDSWNGHRPDHFLQSPTQYAFVYQHTTRTERHTYIQDNSNLLFVMLQVSPDLHKDEHDCSLKQLVLIKLIEKFPRFIETEGLLPHSQTPATELYSMSSKHSPHCQTLFV